MKADQKGIYYIVGESLEAVRKSPFLESLQERGYEVLLMGGEPIDEYAMQALKKFKCKKQDSDEEESDIDFICVTKDDLKLGDADEEVKKSYEPFCKKIKEILGSKIEKCVVSNLLQETPSVLSTGEYGYSANMERIMKAQALQDSSSMSYMSSKKTLKINPGSKIINSIREKIAADDNSVKDLVYLLYDTTLLRSGFSLDNPVDFASRIDKIMELGLGLGVDEDVDDDELPVIPEEGEELASDMEQVD